MTVSYVTDDKFEEAAVNVSKEFDQCSQTILINGEFRRSEASEDRDIVEPATENVIGRLAKTGAGEEFYPNAA